MSIAPIQKGNPHKLTINQHIYPRHALRRFAVNDQLQIKRVGMQEVLPVNTKSKIFCAKRAWDQRTETLFSHQIEKSFADIADMLVAGKIASFTSSMCDVLRQFYALCADRYYFHINPAPDAAFHSMSGSNLTVDEQEILEQKGYHFLRPDRKMPGRMLAGIHMMAHRMHMMRSSTYQSWGVWKSDEGEFVVSDNFSDIVCLPISPNLFLMANSPNYVLDFKNLAELNAATIMRANKYYFARDFRTTPILRRTIPLSNLKISA
jgi:hypothetical protein